MAPTRFLGSNKLPRVNPLSGFPLFKELQDIIAQFLVHGNASLLETAILEKLTTREKGPLQGALLLACFNEIFLLNVLPPESTTGLVARFAEFSKWSKSSPALQSLFKPAERAVFNLFSTPPGHGLGPAPAAGASAMGGGGGASSPRGSPRNSPLLQLTPDSSTDDILTTRLAAHVVAGAMNHGRTGSRNS